jgi:hypothetical protein
MFNASEFEALQLEETLYIKSPQPRRQNSRHRSATIEACTTEACATIDAPEASASDAGGWARASALAPSINAGEKSHRTNAASILNREA